MKPFPLLLSFIQNDSHFKMMLVVNAIITTVTTILFAVSVAHVVNDIFILHQSINDVYGWLILAGLLLTIRTLTHFFCEHTFRTTARNIKQRLRISHVETILTQTLLTDADSTAGSRAVLVCEAAEAIEPWYYDFLPQVVIVGFIIPAILVVALFNDPLSALIMFLTAPILPLFLTLIGLSTAQVNAKRLTSLKRLGGSFLDALSGMKTLKLFGQSRAHAETIRTASESFRKTTMEVLRVSFLSAFVLELTATISIAVIAVSLGIRLINGNLPFFEAFLILLLAPEFYLPIRQLGMKFHTAMSAKEALQGAIPAGDSWQETTESAQLTSGNKENLRSVINAESKKSHFSYTHANTSSLSITLSDITVSYPNKTDPALKNISLTIHPKKITALIGPSGAGKTTLVKTILQLTEYSSGSILFQDDSQTIIDPSNIQKLSAFVPQTPFIFNDTLLENVRFSRPDASIDDIRNALSKASLSHLEGLLSNGLSTVIAEDGASLSRGEMQRVAIARAIVKNTPLIILDEPTASLDPVTDRAIHTTISELAKSKTVLVIAHRLDTIRHADAIHLMDSGTVVASGTHAELFASCQQYQTLIQGWREEQ